MNAEAQKIIDQLNLAPLPDEGGFFRQTWLSSILARNDRNAGSAIYFLLTPADFSALHCLETDEIWHFYAGDRVSHLQFDPGTNRSRITLLGSDISMGESPQLIVRGGTWQGARQAASERPQKGWSLLGCTMAPAWDERGFKLGRRGELLQTFPRKPN